MEVQVVNIGYRGRNYRPVIIPIGDIHYGSKKCDTKYFEDTINWIKKQKEILVIGMGDYCDCINPIDKRYDYRVIDEYRPSEQYAYIYKWFDKIKDKIIGLHSGHHGDTLTTREFNDPDLDLAKSLGVKYLGWEALTLLRFERKVKNENRAIANFTLYSTHGNGGGGTVGMALNKIIAKSRSNDADIYLMGHLHKLVYATDLLNEVKAGHGRYMLTQRKRLYGITGGMLRHPIEGADGYEAKRGYEPIKPGVLKIKLYPELCRNGLRVKDMHISG